ncbi:hypothetical protein BH09MYX1_BH09MYX1_42880 [soil metagenome]
MLARSFRLAAVLSLTTVSGLAAAGAPPVPSHAAPPSVVTPFPRTSPPWLGIEMAVAPEGGVKVSHAVRGAPAALAGIRDGDRITKLDGVAAGAPGDVARNVSARAIGAVVDVVYVRDGAEHPVKVTLTPRPTADEMMRMEYVGTFAPSWAGVTSVSGTVPASPQAARGRVVVVDFWEMSCGPCRLTMPALDAWQSKYGAQGFNVLGITTDAATDAALFISRSGYHYGIASDPAGSTFRTYRVHNIPALFVIDKRGVIREVSPGYEPSEQAHLERVVQQLLAEPAPTP